MAAVTSYATLTTAISDEALRSYTSGETDGFILHAEAEFRLYFGPHFAKETAAATLTVTAGSGTLPTGLIRVLSLSHSTYGPLTETTVETIRALRINGNTTVPDKFAITGTTILTDALYTGSLTLDYEGSLTGLSSGNTTNWLVTYAPMAYLHMCLYYAYLHEEDKATAGDYYTKARRVLEDLGIQSMVTQMSRSSVTIPGATP